MFLTGTLMLVLIDVGQAEPPPLEEITSPEVYSRVGLLRAELEFLRKYMGKPQELRDEIPIRDAEPREVYFQAATLYRKVDRLCFELTRVSNQGPITPPQPILPGHVYGTVDQALQRINVIKKELGIAQQFVEGPVDESITPSEVFRSVVQANRQLNLMLERQISPSDVFQQVTLAIAYAERLIEQYPGEDSTIPDAPEFVANKTPGDVYRRLLTCVAAIQRITRHSGQRSLTLGPLDEEEISRATPSDVYDIASLVVSELAYLHSQRPGIRERHDAYYPGRKFPAHVFQRAGILERQLDQLERLVVADKSSPTPDSTR